MRLSRATAILALTCASPLLAQQADPHAGHHPEGVAAEPDVKASAPDKPCPMMDEMKDHMSGQGKSDRKAMHDKMKACMEKKGKDGETPADQHQH